MKSKIEKMSGYSEVTMKLKINEIIDHLNSQDQEEEKYKILKEARLYPERTLGKLIKETLENTPEEINPYEKITKEYAEAFAKGEEKGDIKRLREEVKDTPEQKEEWEEEFELPDEIEHEDCIEVLADKHKLWEICSWEEPELDPDKVVAFIKQLLEERECRAREEGRREVLEDMRKMWDNDNLGDAPKYGSAGAGLMKRWIRDDINERLSKLTTK